MGTDQALSPVRVRSATSSRPNDVPLDRFTFVLVNAQHALAHDREGRAATPPECGQLRDRRGAIAREVVEQHALLAILLLAEGDEAAADGDQWRVLRARRELQRLDELAGPPANERETPLAARLVGEGALDAIGDPERSGSARPSGAMVGTQAAATPVGSADSRRLAPDQARADRAMGRHASPMSAITQKSAPA